jgi:hypothetical protein
VRVGLCCVVLWVVAWSIWPDGGGLFTIDKPLARLQRATHTRGMCVLWVGGWQNPASAYTAVTCTKKEGSLSGALCQARRDRAVHSLDHVAIWVGRQCARWCLTAPLKPRGVCQLVAAKAAEISLHRCGHACATQVPCHNAATHSSSLP